MKKPFLVSILLITIITFSWFAMTTCQNKVKYEKIIEFKDNQSGYATLTNSDLIILNLSNGKGKRWAEWNQGGKTLKRIDNAGECKYSLDGKYYAYLNLSDERNIAICINNDNDETIAVFELGKSGADFFWTYNSECLFINKDENDIEVILKYNILERTSEQIFETKVHYSPIIVKDENIIYLGSE
jgi:hypothetical protein